VMLRLLCDSIRR